MLPDRFFKLTFFHCTLTTDFSAFMKQVITHPLRECYAALTLINIQGCLECSYNSISIKMTEMPSSATASRSEPAQAIHERMRA